MENLCQSCGMPLDDKQYQSTNRDGSVNTTYCLYCYDKGEFIDGCNSLQDKIDSCISIAVKSGMPKQRAEDMARSILPNLKRWKT